jgi:hypothetical protein
MLPVCIAGYSQPNDCEYIFVPIYHCIWNHGDILSVLWFKASDYVSLWYIHTIHAENGDSSISVVKI